MIGRTYWHEIQPYIRVLILNGLRAGLPLADMCAPWTALETSKRLAILRYLVDSKLLSPYQYMRLTGSMREMAGDLSPAPALLYKVGDKSGTRLLPPVYHRLSTEWLRSNHQAIRPENMNTGHLRNTMLLLKESHGTLQNRVAMALGALHTALRNQPKIQNVVVDLFQIVTSLEVDDFYPVFNALMEEYKDREDMRPEDWDLRNGVERTEIDEDVERQLDIDFDMSGWGN